MLQFCHAYTSDSSPKKTEQANHNRSQTDGFCECLISKCFKILRFKKFLLVKRVTTYCLKEAGPEIFPKPCTYHPSGVLNFIAISKNTTIGKALTLSSPATAMEVDFIAVHLFSFHYFLLQYKLTTAFNLFYF